jgi:hypothetical protein
MRVTWPPTWDKPQPKPTARVREKAEKVKQTKAHRAEVAKAVARRDGHRCRCCGTACDPNAMELMKRAHQHHIVFRSKGGNDTTENLVSLCAWCHADVHAHVLKVEGNADLGLEFWRYTDGGWFLSKREIAVGKVERD